MKIKNWTAICLIGIVLLLSSGCQAVQQQAAAPDIVVVENKNVCEFLYITNMIPGWPTYDAKLGIITRGFVFKFGIDCDDPYLNGDYVGLNDYWGEGDSEGGTGMVEGVTVEGGIWKGTSIHEGGDTIQHDYIGEGKYKGLKLSFVFDITDSSVDYRVTKAAGE
jgi:hypothetical protein